MEIFKFTNYKLRDDILKAIALLGFRIPTVVQEQVIPLVLGNKDVLVNPRQEVEKQHLSPYQFVN